MNTATASTSLSATPFARQFADTSAPQGRSASALRGAGGLASHLQACADARGRWFSLHCLAESVHAAVTPRFFTTILAASALIAVLVEWV